MSARAPRRPATRPYPAALERLTPPDSDEEYVREPPPQYREHETGEGTEQDEEDESDGPRLGRPPGSSELYPVHPPVPVPCALCGKPSEPKETLAVCPRHLSPPHEPAGAFCQLSHEPIWVDANGNSWLCMRLEAWPARCEVEWCGKRIRCELDYLFVHRSCLGATASVKGCTEGCGRPRAFRSTRCRPCQRSHLRDEARIRQARRRSRLQGISRDRETKRDERSRKRG